MRDKGGQPPIPELDRLRSGSGHAVLLVQTIRDLGWTQAELAEHLDVRAATVNDWIRGRFPVPKVVRLYLPLLLRTMNAQRQAHG